METIKTTIDGYRVELEIDPNSEPSTQCWVEKGRYTGSLCSLSNTGLLQNGIDNEHAVSDRTIHKVEEWAERNGY